MKGLLRMKNRIVLIVSLACLFGMAGWSTVQGAAVLHPAHDYSNRISLMDKLPVGSFEDESLDGFVPGPGVEAVLDKGQAFGLRPHEGKAYLLVKSAAGLPGSTWRTVMRRFDTPLDLSSRPAVEFAVFSCEGPAIDQYVRLRLYAGGQMFEARAAIIPTLWRTVSFDLSECPFLAHVQSLEIGLMCDSQEAWEEPFLLDGLCFGQPLDLGFMLPSSASVFSGTGGKVTWADDALRFKFKGAAELASPDLSGSRNRTCNPPLQDRNTFFVVMENKSDVSRIRLSWETLDGHAGEKDFDIAPRSPKQAYFFNVSDIPEARGALKQFSFRSLDGKKGTWIIDEIRFEREEPIRPFAGRISSCTADAERLTITGAVKEDLLEAYPTFAIYECPLKHDTDPIEKLTLLYEGPSKASFRITEIPNSRLDGRMTHLSTRFLAVVKNGKGEWMKVAPAFYVENWRDFSENPYAFELPDVVFNVLDYGAKGDAFTDDTRAIQRAIDACAAAGGGQVLLPGSDGPYGRRYVATHLVLRSRVDLHFGPGAILWQSYDLRHYTYVPAFGHDFDIPGCPWTHCLFINYPLILGNGLEQVKITGPGTIRMSDPYTVNPDWDHYARTCTDRIHICPVAICDSRFVEFTDIDEIRCNNYHTNFPGTENIFIGNVKLYDVMCVSGDGFSFGQGARHIRLDRVFFDSNDDGIVMSNSYRDPRGRISPWRKDRDDADHSIRDLRIRHSYVNSSTRGAGKAIALIPWGTTNPDQTKQELDGVEVYDCVLEGGHSVGTWCDNPHDGKPFTNGERDDYAPVKNFRIIGNEYRSLCDILWVRPTNFITDCGLHSADSFVNANFALGHSYWTMEGKADAAVGYGYASDGGSIYEGLYLQPDAYVFTAEVCGSGSLFVKDLLSGEILYEKSFEAAPAAWEMVTLRFEVPAAADLGLGLVSSKSADGAGNPGARFRRCRLTR